jgi:CRP-like cAMP-binding protein
MVARLVKHPFLAGLNHRQMALLANCALASHFKAGEILFREGEAADRFYLIEKGKVVLESGAGYGAPVVLETIGAGDLLGWSWMMPPYVWHFTARAIEPTEAIHFAGTILREYCEKDHSLGFELHKRMSAVMMKRLQAARKKMLAIHVHGEKLERVVGLSPFMEQELDTYKNEGGKQFDEGAD